MKKKVVVGMSGGVDSSVAAMLLKEQGYDVIGVTMQIWQDEEEAAKEANGGCCGLSAVDDARRVAQRLEIPYYVMNFKKEFKCHVMDYFVAEYLRGHTPNPCIACNRYVKWESLLQRSLEIGADYIATGHYARIDRLPNGRFAIRNSVTAAKDQTYALYNLTQEQLAHTLMPVGEYTKDEIRVLAEEAGLPVAHKPDSQEICFVPDNDYASFIDREAGEKVPGPGNFVTEDGRILGRHKGITHYTLGQRRGLELPMVWGVDFTFTLDNYKRILEPLYLDTFWQSLKLAFTATFFVALIGYPYGYFMAKMNAVWKRRMLLLIMIPFWTSALIRLYGWIIVFRSNGVLDKILMGLHLTKQPLKLLYTYPAVVVGMVYSLLPFMILAVYSSAEKLDASLVEASRDLGASAWKAFWTVSFRLTLPGLLSGVVLSFIPSMGLFFIADILGGNKIVLVGSVIQEQITKGRNQPFAAALSAVLMILTSVMIRLYRKITGTSQLEGMM